MRHEAQPDELTDAVAEAADAWGGGFQRHGQGGDLVLPVQAGLRHGRLEGRVEVRPDETGSRLTLTVERIDYRVHRPAMIILLLGAAAGLVLVLWPFVPGLEGLLPIALILVVGAWFLVVSRLQNRGAEEFLATVESFAGSGDARPPRPPGKRRRKPPVVPAEPTGGPEGEPGETGLDPRPTEPRSWS
jgi:hypothetical protein